MIITSMPYYRSSTIIQHTGAVVVALEVVRLSLQTQKFQKPIKQLPAKKSPSSSRIQKRKFIANFQTVLYWRKLQQSPKHWTAVTTDLSSAIFKRSSVQKLLHTHNRLPAVHTSPFEFQKVNKILNILLLQISILNKVQHILLLPVSIIPPESLDGAY